MLKFGLSKVSVALFIYSKTGVSYFLKIFSIVFPLASSSTSLSR
jgi:hypothetical protein